jgi:hypothetical protein
MRYLVGFVLALALAALPLSVCAQDAEEGTTAEPNAAEPAPSSEPAPEEPVPPSEPVPEEPALQLKLDDAGVGVVPSPPRTPDGYTLEEMELRVKRAKIGLGVSGGALLVGLVMGFVALANYESCFLRWECPEYPDWVGPVGWTGFTLAMGGLTGMIVSRVRLARHKRARNWLRRPHYGGPHTVRWDLARSRLVF